MYAQIKQLADEAIALQNKNGMDAALREISALCAPSAANKAMVEAIASEVGGQAVAYGEAKVFGSEAEMIADVQGSPSPVTTPPAAPAKPGKKGVK